MNISNATPDRIYIKGVTHYNEYKDLGTIDLRKLGMTAAIWFAILVVAIPLDWFLVTISN